MLKKEHHILLLHRTVVRVLLTSIKRNHCRNGIIIEILRTNSAKVVFITFNRIVH